MVSIKNLAAALGIFAGIVLFAELAATQSSTQGGGLSTRAIQALEECFNSSGAFLCAPSGGVASVGVTNPPGGTTNTIAKWTAATTLGDSGITDNGTDMALSAANNIDLTAGTHIILSNVGASVSLVSGSLTLVHEGTADAFETTVSFTNPTADITYSLPNQPAGTYPLVSSTHATNAVDAASSVWTEFNAVVWEGSTADAFESIFRGPNPTQDQFFFFPNTGTIGGGTVLLDTFALMSGTTRIQLGSDVFASLGSPTNGNILYCSNCTIANPCASGGTGALAKRLNSVWVCN